MILDTAMFWLNRVVNKTIRERMSAREFVYLSDVAYVSVKK